MHGLADAASSVSPRNFPPCARPNESSNCFYIPVYSKSSVCRVHVHIRVADSVDHLVLVSSDDSCTAGLRRLVQSVECRIAMICERKNTLRLFTDISSDGIHCHWVYVGPVLVHFTLQLHNNIAAGATTVKHS